jgi:hypothetical protein
MITRTHTQTILGVLILGVGCASCTNPTPGYDYHVVIDPKFSSEDVNAIHVAVEAWRTITDGELSISYDTTGECGTAKIVCIHTSSSAWIVSHGGEPGFIGYTIRHDWLLNSADVYIPTAADAGYNSTQMVQILSHEMGHVLGLSHTTAGPLMCAGQSCAALLPTCDDYAQLADIRGTWQSTTSCPHGGTYTLTSDDQTIHY